MKRSLLAVGLVCIAFAATLSAEENSARCVQITWFDNAAAQKETTVQGILYPVENKLIYDWKNGAMEFMWTLPEGMKSGDPNGFEGTWQQDDGKGTFSVKENRKTAVFEGTWKKEGRKKNNKLKVEYCKS